MKTTITELTSPSRVACTACLTHSRPLGVPWQQHVIGCPVRVAALGGPRQPVAIQGVRVGIA